MKILQIILIAITINLSFPIYSQLGELKKIGSDLKKIKQKVQQNKQKEESKIAQVEKQNQIKKSFVSKTKSYNVFRSQKEEQERLEKFGNYSLIVKNAIKDISIKKGDTILSSKFVLLDKVSLKLEHRKFYYIKATKSGNPYDKFVNYYPEYATFDMVEDTIIIQDIFETSDFDGFFFKKVMLEIRNLSNAGELYYTEADFLHYDKIVRLELGTFGAIILTHSFNSYLFKYTNYFDLNEFEKRKYLDNYKLDFEKAKRIYEDTTNTYYLSTHAVLGDYNFKTNEFPFEIKINTTIKDKSDLSINYNPKNEFGNVFADGVDTKGYLEQLYIRLVNLESIKSIPVTVDIAEKIVSNPYVDRRSIKIQLQTKPNLENSTSTQVFLEVVKIDIMNNKDEILHSFIPNKQ